LAQSLSQVLNDERYSLYLPHSESSFFNVVEEHKDQIDCLILQEDDTEAKLINRLSEQGMLFPIVILSEDLKEIPFVPIANHHPNSNPNIDNSNSFSTQVKPVFHTAEVWMKPSQLSEIGTFIDQAIAQFVSLSPATSITNSSTTAEVVTELSNRNFLLQQQRRLSEKLKERLGYLGVYYKRNPQLFLRHLSPSERQKLLENLKSEYRQIVLKYFSPDQTLNQKIDNFVDKAFFADISVSRIVEIHMELMEEFSKQLKLEGRSEEILLDYRLTLIDVIAHLGEMYRRSIPRES
jgi:circadian clock protein KaiA